MPTILSFFYGVRYMDLIYSFDFLARSSAANVELRVFFVKICRYARASIF